MLHIVLYSRVAELNFLGDDSCAFLVVVDDARYNSFRQLNCICIWAVEYVDDRFRDVIRVLSYDWWADCSRIVLVGIGWWQCRSWCWTTTIS